MNTLDLPPAPTVLTEDGPTMAQVQDSIKRLQKRVRTLETEAGRADQGSLYSPPRHQEPTQDHQQRATPTVTRRRLISTLTAALGGLMFWRPKPAPTAIHVSAAARKFQDARAEYFWNQGPGKPYDGRCVILNGHEIAPLSEHDAETFGL